MNEFVTETPPVVLAVAGILIPLIVAAINGVTWSHAVKALVSAVVSLVLGAGLGVAVGIDSGEGLLTAAVATYMVGQIGYFGIIKPTGLADTVETKVLPRG